MDLTIITKCNQCGGFVEAELSVRNEEVVVVVTPCERCLDSSYEKGRKEGYDEGRDVGYSDGYDEGKAEAEENQ